MVLLEIEQLAIERILCDAGKHVFGTRYRMRVKLWMQAKDAVYLGASNVPFEIAYQGERAMLTEDPLRSVSLK